MFSVVIPLYNKELSIKNTIQSVLNQTFRDFEIIVVNDGSTDNSEIVAKSIDDKRIRYISQPNRGVSSARNRGIKVAKFDWICLLDGDDIWLDFHLEHIFKLIQTFPMNNIFTTSFKYSNTSSSISSTLDYILVKDYFEEALCNIIIWTSVVAINRKCFKLVGYFDENLSRGEDTDMWARLGRKFSIVKSNTITAIYRQNGENRACVNKVPLRNSIVSKIDLKGLTGSERKYFQQIIRKKIKSLIFELDFKSAVFLVKKFNFQLL